MKKIGIAINDSKDWTAKALIESTRQKKIEPSVINLKNAAATIHLGVSYSANGTDLSELDALIVRDVGAGVFDGVSFRFDVLRQLAKEGVMVVNTPEAIQNAANKYYSTCLLAKADLPIPRTEAVQSTGDALNSIAEFGDAIIKPVFGYKGIGILRIKDGTACWSDKRETTTSIEKLINDMIRERGMLYIQKFITNPGRDIRAFVVNGNVIGAIYRTAPKGSWINNISQGGTAGRCVLSSELEELCIKAAETIGTVFAGVDIIEGPDDATILEVNGTPSGEGVYKAWGINAAEHIIDYITSRT
ncbi:MAG: RimK family alpha-L-glutamate ligase [Methanosarcinaceae archaeon]|nr:RimK family alpha-L-glutamate ligase [Methanosarcinaceae archaeon]